MKMKDLLTTAIDKVKTEQEAWAVEELKVSLKSIADCKKTLKKLEKAHLKLLESDIDDLEIDGYEY